MCTQEGSERGSSSSSSIAVRIRVQYEPLDWPKNRPDVSADATFKLKDRPEAKVQYGTVVATVQYGGTVAANRRLGGLLLCPYE